MKRTITVKAGERNITMTLSNCATEHLGDPAPALLAKREPNLETELIRFDKHIRLDGNNGTFSDVFTKVVDVKSKGKDIIVILDFESITAPPSSSIGLMVFDHFLVKEDNGEIVVYAKEEEHDLPPTDHFNVKIRYEDEGISCAQEFVVTDRISIVVLDVGSHSSQAKVYDEKGTRRVPLLGSMIDICKDSSDPKELDQCDETDECLMRNEHHVTDNSYPMSDTEMIAQPSKTDRFLPITRRDDNKSGLKKVPNHKSNRMPFGSIDEMSIKLKTIMLTLHAVCAYLFNSNEKEQRPLALRIHLEIPNVLTQRELYLLLNRLTRLANNHHFLSLYGLECIEFQSISESDSPLNAFVASRKECFHGRFLVVDEGQSTRDYTVADVCDRQVIPIYRGGDEKGGNTKGFATWIEMLNTFESYGKDRIKLARRLLTCQNYLLNEQAEIAEKKKREFDPGQSGSPLIMTENASKLSDEKIVELMDSLNVEDTFQTIKQTVEDDVNDLEKMIRYWKIDYLLLSGRAFLFKPLLAKVKEVAARLGVKVFVDNDPYMLKCAQLDGALTGYQKEYNMVGFPMVKEAIKYKEYKTIDVIAWKIIDFFGWRECLNMFSRIKSGKYTNIPQTGRDEKMLKSGGILIPYADNLRIFVNNVEYEQARIIIIPEKQQKACYVKLSPDGRFYLRYKNLQSELVPVPVTKDDGNLLAVLFPWSLKLIPTLSLDNLPEVHIKS